MTVEFKVYTKIRGKARPRFARATGRAYTTQEDRLVEDIIREAYRSSQDVFFDGYVKAEIDVYHKIPKSYSKKRRDKCLSGEERPGKKPDL